jgi:hypothetical protein
VSGSPEGTQRFLAAYPCLFHVADTGAVPLIRQHGLLSAKTLACLFQIPAARRPSLLTSNRDRYAELSHAVHGRAWLRVQHMREYSLRSRLQPAIGLGQWRRFINRHTFFWTSQADAERFSRYERERHQVVLAWRTEDVMAAGVPLLACRYNNGSTSDRTPLHRRRLRAFEDYRPIEDLPPRFPAKEVVARSGIPPSVPFELLPQK